MLSGHKNKMAAQSLATQNHAVCVEQCHGMWHDLDYFASKDNTIEQANRLECFTKFEQKYYAS